jgi:two-component system sensor histidine kinase LytS
MLIFKKINFIFIFLVLSNLQAQQSSFQKFSIENGLTSNVIFDVTQDKTGYLWIATDKGSVKFDGDDFTQINKQEITCIKAQNNTIYIGLENGLLTRNGNQEHFFESKEVRNIFFYKEHVFIGTVKGIYKLHKAYLHPIQINAAIDFSIINDLIFDDNSFYVATNNGLWKLNSLEKPKEIEKILKDKVVSLLKFQNKIIAATFKNSIHIINNNYV